MNRKPGSIVIALTMSFMLVTVLMVSIANAASLRPDGASFIRPLGPSSSGAIRISQVYGGGGNASAPYKRDFIELFNIGTTSVTFASWSVQYAAATGTSWSVTLITGTIEPGQYYLVAEAAGTGCSGAPCGSDLPTPDVTGTIAMALGAGKVALVNNSTALSGTCPSSASIQDFIGYGGTANCSETSPATAPSNTTADIRKLNGCQDLDDNSKDFSALAPNPRNTSSPINICGLSISKSAVAQTNYNSAFTYTLTITNATITATDVVITDLIPSNVTYVPNSASSGGDLLNGDTVSWTIATMTHTAIVSRTFVVTAPTSSGSIVNQLYRVSAGSITSDAFGSAITTTVLAPALGMIKTATPNSNVTYHSLVTYSIMLSNSGLADALNTFVTDTLPSEVDFASWITQSGASQNSDQITWNGTISIGKAITLTFVVTHVGNYGDVVTNTAQFDQLSGSGAGSAAFNVEAGLSSLSMRKSVTPSSVADHDLVTYSIVLSNVGTADAPNTVVTDTLPSEVDFARWLDQPIGANLNSDQITWNGTISVGQAITFTFAVTHVGTYGDVITNTAQFDQANGSGSASAAFDVGLPNLHVAKSASPNSNVAYHGEVTYTLVLSNNGTGTAFNTFLTDTLPGEVDFARWIDQSGAAINSDQITWNGTVAVNQPITLTFVVTHVGSYGDVVTNTVFLDHATGSGSSSAVFNVVTPRLQIHKGAAPTSNVAYHGEVTYTLVVSNDGSAAALNTFVTDTLPSEVDFTRWIDQAGASEIADQITWNGSITSGQSITIAFVVTHIGNYADVVTNTAQFDQVTGSGSSSAIFTVVSATPNLTLTKSVYPSANVNDHGEVTYTIMLTNSGASDASNTFFTDTLPGGVTFARWIDQAGASENANVITWNGIVTAASAIRFSFVATHTGSYGDVITNTAQFDQASGSGSASAAFSVGSPNLHIGKRVNPNSNVNYHRTVTYTTVLTNNGSSDALNTFFTDTLPSEVDFAHWIDQPSGANVSADQITWNGSVLIDQPITFTFVVTHVGSYGDGVTNTAQFGHATSNGSSSATFTVEPLYPITFVYHDGEDVVLSGEPVSITTDFNGVTPLNADPGYTTFSNTIGLPAGVHSYRYIVIDQPDWLNTLTRSITVTTAATIDDYRNVIVAAAKLQAPSATTTTVGVATENIFGRVHISGVTEPSGVGRGIHALLGYGTNASPINWTWSPLNFDSQVANDDQFQASIVPTSTGLYSYAVRFDANWGVGNPNALWTYGDLNDLPFSIDQAGVLHVFNGPNLSIGKQVTPTLRVSRGGVVTYTIVVTNNGDLIANNVFFTDTLPALADFSAWIISPTNTIAASDVITWSGSLQSGGTITWEFTSIVTGAYASSVTNTVSIAYNNVVTSSSAAFTFDSAPIIINEIDSDTPGTDAAEFIELYDGGVGNTSLSGLVVVLFNGADDKVYAPTFDLDGYSTDANGYLVIGNSAVAGVVITFADNKLQNGPDAAALFVGNASDFPVNKTITNTDLSQELDAIVYRGVTAGTAPNLMALLNAGQSIANENSRITATTQSLQRCPNGSGGARNTATYYPSTPTPRTANACASLNLTKSASPNNNVAYHSNVTYTLVLSNSGAGDALTTLLTDTLPSEVDFARWINRSGANVTSDVITWTGEVTANQAITFTFVVTHVGSYGDVVTNTALFDHNTGSGSSIAVFNVLPATPHLSMIKSVSPFSNVSYHGNVTYTLVLSNDGSADAANTFLTDTLPGEVDFARWINQSGASINFDVITWNGTISIGQSITFTFVVTHVGNYGDVVTNTAQFDQASGSGSSSATFTVVTATPNLLVSKSVSPNSAVAYHGEVTYTLLLTNSGAADALNTLVTDTLPSEVNFGSWINQSGANVNADQITWSGTVSSGQSIAIMFVVTHVGSYGDVVTNTAQFDQASGSGSSSATFTVVPATPHLVLTKNVNPSSNVTNQSVVTYSIVLTNDGSAAANGVLMTDTLPGALTFSTWIVSPTNTVLNGQLITWNGNLAAGSTISWDFTSIVSGTGLTVINTAQINYSGSITSASATVTIMPSINVLINELDSQMASTDTQEFIELYDGGVGHTPLDGLALVFFNGGVANDPSYFSIDLDNHQTDANGYFVVGNSAVASAVITFADSKIQNGPDAVGLFMGNAADFPNGTPATNTNVIDALVYSANTGDDAVLRSTLLNANQPIAYEGSSVSQAEIKSAQRCPDGSGGYRNTATYMSSAPTPGAANACPVLSITKNVTPTSNVAYHGNVTYTLVLNNNGSGDAASTQLTDTLPSEVDFARWINRSGAVATNDVITWTGNVTANQSITFTFVATHTGNYADVVTNTAQFYHMSGSGSSSATFRVRPAAPSLSIAKSVATLHHPVKLGDPITYTIVVTNSGPGNAIGVVISDVLPTGVSGTNLNQTINISASRRVSFTLAGVVTSNVAYYGKSITNTVSFSHTSGRGSASAVITIESGPPANIGAIKFSTPNNRRVLPNSLITYTIVLSNSGGVSATARITDVLGSYYTLFNALNFTQAPTGTLKWSGVVTAGQSITLNFVAKVKAVGQLTVGHTILNNAATLDDGSHVPSILNAPNPPWVDVYGIHLPLLRKNS